MRLASSEFAKRPGSADARFALASLFMARSTDLKSFEMATDLLEQGRRLPGAGSMFEQLLITEHARRHRATKREWWMDLTRKLLQKPPNAADLRVLSKLNQCFVHGLCKEDPNWLEQAYAAARSHRTRSPTLSLVHAEFSWHVLNERKRAVADTWEAVSAAPNDLTARQSLVVILLSTGQIEAARSQLAIFKRLDLFGTHEKTIALIEEKLGAQEARATP